MRSLTLVILISSAVFSGIQVQNSGDPTAHIEGVVLDGTTDQPLAGASAGGVTTGPDGKFAVDLPILPLCTPAGGRCRTGLPTLTVTRQGFMPGQPNGRKLPGTPGIPLSVVPGDRIEGLTVRLFPPGSIAGKILDSRGQPMQGVELFPFRDFYNDAGTRTRQLFGSLGVPAKTNDLGEFRISNLDAGDYHVEIRPEPLEMGQNQFLAPVFYPGSTDPLRAEAVRVERGKETEVRDIVLAPVTGGILRIRLVNEVGEGPRGTTLVRADRRNDWMVGVRNLTVQRGDFGNVAEMGRLAPGDYDIRAMYATFNSGSVEGFVPVTMGNTDVLVNLPIRKVPDGSITGRAVITSPTGDEQPVAGVSLGLSPVVQTTIPLARGGLAFFPPLTSIGNGTFPAWRVAGANISHARSGPVYRVRVDAVPSGMFVTSITDGTRDVINDGLFVSAERETSITVRLATGAGSIEGTALDSKAERVPTAVAVLIPDGSGPRGPMITTLSDFKGTYRIEAGPGPYHLYVWRELPGAAYLNKEFMERYKDRGTPVSVVANGRVTLNATVLEN